LVAGDLGEMYGTTPYGGTGDCKDIYPGCGTIFKLTPEVDGGFGESTTYNFLNHGDGANPLAVVRDTAGALYGVTADYSVTAVLFKILPSATGRSKKTLYRFTGTSNRGAP
jgi:hypothetical protein